MNNIIQKSFNKIITNLIKQINTQCILLAISGGQDSLCLIKLVENFKNNYERSNQKLKTEYIYIDHQWKSNSKKKIKYLIHYLKSIQENLKIYQVKDITFSEDTCRKYRYNIIFQHAVKYKQKIIITAHTSTDKTETFFQNLIRGTSIEGLNSLNLQRKVNKNLYIIRPLINTSRDNIYWMCKKFFLPIWSDTTNYNYYIERNRIRNEFIPYLKTYFHKDIENRIEYFLKIYYYDNEYIKQSILKLYLNSIHNKYIALNYEKIQKQNFGLQIRTIQFFSFHNFYIFLNFKKLVKFLSNINKQKTNSYIKYKNLKFHIINYWIYVSIQN
uniref:tRNA(Ile)-lysidine synthase, chloroplastic n=1 Tax=Bostrychia simpliciuscula TaxID=324754 RepID=A0A1Z1M7G0_9FLOR|nr:tRNA Ile-lysidine synthetase [Bostrychia simpliciuscula]ARW62027.1 tRNA Ile-lysidine synthetase [Bostrychia simpliciuscula]